MASTRITAPPLTKSPGSNPAQQSPSKTFGSEPSGSHPGCQAPPLRNPGRRAYVMRCSVSFIPSSDQATQRLSRTAGNARLTAVASSRTARQLQKGYGPLYSPSALGIRRQSLLGRWAGAAVDVNGAGHCGSPLDGRLTGRRAVVSLNSAKQNGRGREAVTSGLVNQGITYINF